MAKTKYSFTPIQWERFKQDLQILRLCPSIPSTTAIRLSRAYKKIEKAMGSLNDQIVVTRNEFVEAKKIRDQQPDANLLNWTSEDQQAYGKLETDVTSKPLELELDEITSADFPTLAAGTNQGLGIRKFLKEDRQGRVMEGETHFFDNYLNLLGEVIKDLDDVPGLHAVTDDTKES